MFEVTGQVASLAEAQLADTRRVVTNARRGLARGRIRPAGRLRAVVEGSCRPPSSGPAACSSSPHPPCRWDARGASRLVSLHDPDARPIGKGRLGRPVEFGSKAQVLDNPDGMVLDHQVMVGTRRMRRCWFPRSSG